MRNPLVFCTVILVLFYLPKVDAQSKLVLPLGHTDFVNSVDISSDGKIGVSASNDIRIWEIPSGRLIRTIMSPSLSVRVVPNSSLGVSGQYEGTISVWDLKKGNKLREIKAHDNGLKSIAVSLDGKLILSGGEDKSVKIWSLNSGNLIREVKVHSGIINSLAISPDNKLGLSSSDSTIILWDVESGGKIREFKGRSIGERSVAFSNNGKFWIGGGEKMGEINMWDTKTHKLISKFNLYEKNDSIDFSDMYGVYISKDDKRVVFTDNSQITCKDIASGRTLFSKWSANWTFQSIVVSSDQKYLFFAGYNGLGVREFETGNEIKYFGNSTTFGSVTISNDGNLLQWGGGYLSDLSNGRSISVPYSRLGFTGVNFNQGDKLDLSQDYETNELYLKDVFSGKNLWSINYIKYNDINGTFYQNDIAISNNGNEIFSIWNYKSIKLLKPQTQQIVSLYEITDKSTMIDKISINESSSEIILGARTKGGNEIIFLDSKTGIEKIRIKAHKDIISALNISTDGKYLLSGSWDDEVKFWDLTNKKLVKKFKTGIGCSNLELDNNSKTFLSGHFDGAIYLWDIETNNIIQKFQGHEGSIESLKFMDDNKFIISASTDGTTRIWEIKTGKELLKLISFKDKENWLAISPDGRFDGTKGGIKQLHYVDGLETVPVESFYEKFFTPGLTAQVIAGNNLAKQESLKNGFSLPPRVQIVTQGSSSNTLKEVISLTVEATDQGGGIDEIRLYHNGKLIDGTDRGFKPVSKTGNKEIKTFNISLIDGENRFSAVAFNNQRTESAPYEIVLNYKSPLLVKPNMYILAIGINSYLNPKYSLNYAKNDANAFVQFLKKGASPIFEKVEATIVSDENATREGIIAAIDNIKSISKPEDVFVFYYAGHGVMSTGSETEKSQFYLVPYDVTKMYDADDKLKKSGLSATELADLSKKIKAQKQLYVIDACQSGGAVQTLAMRGAAEEKAIAQLARSTGTYFIAASGSEQFATEVAELGHGIFTYSIIEALKGSCKSQDGKLTVNMLKSCIEDLVPELSKKHKGQPQFPTGYGFGQDFPIVIVK